jgi:hypothetical protein
MVVMVVILWYYGIGLCILWQISADFTDKKCTGQNNCRETTNSIEMKTM